MLSHLLQVVLTFTVHALLVQATRQVTILAGDRAAVEYRPATGTTAWTIGAVNSSIVCGGGYAYSNDNFADLVVTFTGIAVSLPMIRFANGSLVLIELDGVQQKVVDTYSPGTDCFSMMFEKSGLSDGPHKLRLADATHNTTSKWFRFQQLIYTEYTPEERASMAATASAVVASSVSLASLASVSASSAAAASQKAQDDGDKRSRDRIIIGAAVGGVVGLALIVGVVFVLLRNKRKPKQPAIPPAGGQAPFNGAWQEPVSSYKLPPQLSGPYDPNAQFANYSLSYQPGYNTSPNPSERPMSQFSGSELQNMSTMGAGMLNNQIPHQQTGVTQASIPEPMNLTSSARQVSAVMSGPPYVPYPGAPGSSSALPR